MRIEEEVDEKEDTPGLVSREVIQGGGLRRFGGNCGQAQGTRWFLCQRRAAYKARAITTSGCTVIFRLGVKGAASH